jgi:hypothetical protein
VQMFMGMGRLVPRLTVPATTGLTVFWGEVPKKTN